MDEVNVDDTDNYDMPDYYITIPYLILNSFQNILPELLDEIIISMVTKLEDHDMLVRKNCAEYATAYSMEFEKIPKPETCPICMMDSDEINDPVFKTGCGHVFCAGCFSGLVLEGIDKCPMCRSELDPRTCRFSDV